MKLSDDQRDRLGNIIAAGLLIALVFSALAFGAVEPWSLFLFEMMVLALIALWVARGAVNKRLSVVVPDAALPFAALLVLGIVQAVAIPDKGGRWMSLSVDVGSTRMTITALVFIFVAFLLISNTFTTRKRLLLVCQFLVIYGLAMAVFALIQHFTWDGRFYWLRPTIATSPFGPFVNHNHFAGYMELLIPLPLAMAIVPVVRTEIRLLYLFAAGMMGVAAVAALSRGGMISLAAAILYIAFMSIRLRRERPTRKLAMFFSQAVVMIAIISVITAGIIWIGADPIIQRVARGQSADSSPVQETFHSSRGWIWRDTISMIRANPFSGVGIGAYETAFPIYSESDGSLRVPQAHNDYLQVMSDAGLIGCAIALWFIVIVVRTLSRGMRSSDPLLSAIVLGSGGGIFAILVHSMFDFNLQIPSNGLLFLLLVAISSNVAALVPESKRNNPLAMRRRTGEQVPVVLQRGG